MKPLLKQPWYHHAVRWLYSVVLLGLLPVIIFMLRKKLSVKAQPEHIQQRKFRERLGILPSNIKRTDILFHCASVGEINASQAIINHILAIEPSLKVTISTTSVTGATHAFGLFKDRVQHCFLAFDIPLFVHSMLKRLSPKHVIITEVEFWPNLVHLSYKRKIKLFLINARISSKSLPTYLKLSALYRYTLRKFSAICAQDQGSYERFLMLGIFKSQLFLTNNIKFDLRASTEDQDKAKKLAAQFNFSNKDVLLGASTHSPEEILLLEAYATLKAYFPALVLCLVPRHPHRFDEVYALCKASGFNVCRFSETQNSSETDIVIIDAMGWLKACYQLCQLAFIGGSFSPRGGHNALECALFGKAMLMGPSIFNNPEICHQLEDVGALIILEDSQAMTPALKQMLENKEDTKLAGASGKQVLTQNSGAIEGTLEVLLPLILEQKS